MQCLKLAPSTPKKEFEKLVIMNGFSLISDYHSDNINVLLKCKKNHTVSIFPMQFKENTSCPKCNLKTKKSIKYHAKH